MRKNVERRARGRARWRRYLYALSGLIVIWALIYWEQTALLYGVSTLAVCALLLAVAFADLEGKDRELFEAREANTPAPPAERRVALAEHPQDEIVSEVARR